MQRERECVHLQDFCLPPSGLFVSVCVVNYISVYGKCPCVCFVLMYAREYLSVIAVQAAIATGAGAPDSNPTTTVICMALCLICVCFLTNHLSPPKKIPV